MKRILTGPVCRGAVVLALAAPPLTSLATLSDAPNPGIEQVNAQVTDLKLTGATSAELTFANGQRLVFAF